MAYTRLNPKVQPLESTTASTVSGVSTADDIILEKRGGVVTMTINRLDTVSALTARTTVANIPSGWRPATTLYPMFTNIFEQYIVNPNGTIQMNARQTGVRYGSVTYVVAN